MKNQSFARLLAGGKPEASSAFAKALRGESLSAVEALRLDLDGVQARLRERRSGGRRLAEAKDKPGVYKDGELERWLDDIAKSKLLVKKKGESDKVAPPQLRRGHAVKRPKPDNDGLSIDDRVALLSDIVRDIKGEKRESVSPRRPSGKMVRLTEACTLQERSMCSCKRCLHGYC